MKLQKRLEIAGFRRKGGSPTYAPVKEHPETWLRDNVRIVLHSYVNTVYREVDSDSSYPPEVRKEDMSDEMLFCWLNEHCPLPTFDELVVQLFPKVAINFSRVDSVQHLYTEIVLHIKDTVLRADVEDWQAEILLDGFRKLFK